MTIIEVMIAMVILLVGVLGTLVLIEGGLSSTSRTTAREQSTNVARDLVERTRQIAYANVTTSLAPATLRATLPSSEVGALSGSSFDVTRRNVTYTVTVSACSVDDPTDGAGVGDATFCAPPATPPPVIPPPLPLPPAPAHNVLGIDVGSILVAAGGDLLTTVCNALGLPIGGSTILGQLTSAVSAVAPLSVCPGAAPGTPGVKYDAQPDDLRRVRIDVSWTSRGGGSVSQTTLLTNPLQS
jgi:type II secretory pathway pseudopilin PulG